MSSPFVELWYGDLLPITVEVQNYYPLLNDEEKKKAASYKRPELQQKYIKTRGVLREVLASYLNIKPQKINIKIGEYGKPFIDQSGVFFNLSHTGNRLVIAVSNCAELGVDLEQAKDRNSIAGLVDKCFSVQEKVYWKNLPEAQKMLMFYRFWVRKEAFVKAVGRGIALGLNQCIVNPEKQTDFLNIPNGCGTADEWKIVDVVLNKDDICAVVIKEMEFSFKQIELK